MLKFSIIIPVFNCEKYVQRCVNSIINQNYPELEIILIDDGSTDNSCNICDQIANRNSNVRVIHKINGGVSSARNTGIENSTGEYILFVDADDYIDDNIFTFANNILEKYNIDLLKFNYSKIYGNICKKYFFSVPTNKVICKSDYDNLIFKYLFNTSDFGNVWNCIFRKKIIENIDFDTNLKYAEDRKFLFQALLNSETLYVSDNNFYNYVINESSAMNKKDYQKSLVQLKNVLEVNNMIYTIINDKSLDKTYEESVLSDIKDFIINNLNFKSYKNYKEELTSFFKINNIMELVNSNNKIDMLKYFSEYRKYLNLKTTKFINSIKKRIKKIILK